MTRIAPASAAAAMAAAIAIALAAPAPAPAQDAAIRIVQSRGTIVRSPERIGSVLIADPAIANVQPLSDRVLFVVGKSNGATELFILDGDQNVIERRGVFVTRSLADMRRAQPNATEGGS